VRWGAAYAGMTSKKDGNDISAREMPFSG